MYYLLAQYVFNYIWITHCSFQHSTVLPIAKASVQWSELHIPCSFTQWSIRCGASRGVAWEAEENKVCPTRRKGSWGDSGEEAESRGEGKAGSAAFTGTEIPLFLQMFLLPSSLYPPTGCTLVLCAVPSVPCCVWSVSVLLFLWFSQDVVLWSTFQVTDPLFSPNTINPVCWDLLSVITSYSFQTSVFSVNSVSLITFFILSSSFLGLLITMFYTTCLSIWLISVLNCTVFFSPGFFPLGLICSMVDFHWVSHIVLEKL